MESSLNRLTDLIQLLYLFELYFVDYLFDGINCCNAIKNKKRNCEHPFEAGG